MEQLLTIGKSVKRVDALEKVTGQAMYTSDVILPHMLYAKILRNPHAHANIINIDTSMAEKLAGVRAVLTGKDAPERKLYCLQDRYILARDSVRFVGEPVAAVAADSIEIVEEALDLIEVEYEELPAIFDPEESMKPNQSVVLHPDLTTRFWSPFYQGPDPSKAPVNEVAAERPNVIAYSRVRDGDTDKGFQESDLIIEERYVRPRIQHVPMEPHATVVRPEPDGGLTLWVTSQTIYPEKEHLCRIFKLPFNKVRVIGLHQGGGFGSRVEGLGVSIHITTLAALKAKRPVKLMYTRDEVFIDGITEMPMVIYIKDGVKKDGTISAREMKVIINAGAYSGNNVVGAYNIGWASGGTYKVNNFKFDSYVVVTNETVSGPFRGFGANPPIWAIESQMDLIAEKLEMDPAELRRKNVLKEGEKSNLGETTHNIAIEDSLNKVLEGINWGKASQEAQKGPWKKGKGLALSNKFTSGHFASAVAVKVHPDATFEVRHSAIDLGQGCDTALTQIAAEEFRVSVDKIKIVSADTAITPPDHGTISNRVTWHTGNALRLACKDLKGQIMERASAILRVPPENLIIEDGLIHKKRSTKVAMRIFDLFTPPGMYLCKDGELIGKGTYISPVIGPDIETGQSPRLVSYYSWGACAAEVAVNVDTGEIKVLQVAQCFDMGRPINPEICEGQIEGGIGMGIGSALFEEMIVKEGVVLNPNLIDYRIPSIVEIPTENVKAMIAECDPHEEGPFGAKGFAEGGLLPMTPAITNAVANAVGVRIRTLPITRERLLKSLGALGEKN